VRTLSIMRPTTLIPIAQSPLNTCKSFLLVGERVVVVDSGPPGGERRVIRALAEGGLEPERVSLILVTHSHPDHVGGAAALRRFTGAVIAADPLECEYLEGHSRAPTNPTGIAGRLFLRTPLPHQRFETFSPDVLVDDTFDLRPYGVEANIHRSGGHTAGTLSVHVPGSGELIAGDLLAGGIGIGGILFHGRVIEPPFHHDAARVRVAVAELLALEGLRSVHVCHGGPLRPLDIARWLQREKRAGRGRAQVPQ
jgi:hydroxyacylglutathione hydrolase